MRVTVVMQNYNLVQVAARGTCSPRDISLLGVSTIPPLDERKALETHFSCNLCKQS